MVTIFFKVQKHFSFSSDITQKKAQFFDHWFLCHRPEWYVLVVRLNKHARTTPTWSTNKQKKITLDFFFFPRSFTLLHTYYQHFSKESKYLATGTGKKVSTVIYNNKHNKYKRIFDIIYMVSKREGNGPSVRRVFTKVMSFFFFLPEVEFCHLQFKVLLNILID